MVSLYHVINVGFVPKFLEIGVLLFSGRHLPQGRETPVGIILLPQFIDSFITPLAELAESERHDADLVAAAAEDGNDVVGEELRIAAGNVYIHVGAFVKTVDNLLEAVHFLNFVEEDVVWFDLGGYPGV